MTDRVEVRKTYKLFVGGAFPRSESGRTYEVNDANGEFLANAGPCPSGKRKISKIIFTLFSIHEAFWFKFQRTLPVSWIPMGNVWEE